MPEGAEASPHNKNPQLFQHKPSKAQVKKAKASAPPPPSSRPMASSSSSGPGLPPPPPAATQKRSFIRRMVPFLLAANLAVGVFQSGNPACSRCLDEVEDANYLFYKCESSLEACHLFWNQAVCIDDVSDFWSSIG